MLPCLAEAINEPPTRLGRSNLASAGIMPGMVPRVTLAALLVLLTAHAAAAHPLTDLRFDRTAAVRLSGAGVEVAYTLELSPFALYLDAAKRLPKDEIAKLDKSARGLAAAYAKHVAAEVVEQFRVTVDGQPVRLAVAGVDVTMRDHASCRITLRAPWPPGGGDHTVGVDDATFLDQPGVVNLTLDRKGTGGGPFELLDADEPPIGVRTQHSSKLTPEQAAQARKATAVVRLPVPPKPSEPVKPPESSPPAPEPVVNADAPSQPGLAADLAQRGLPALFDSDLGVGAMLLAALAFGAAHAFTPGHGKTLVAAYLVGERGTVRHAVVLAVATTVAHTGSVILVAAVLWGVYGNNVPLAAQSALQLVAGLLVIAVGLWLLLRRATGQADHFHLFAGHHHHHGDGHGHHHHHHGDGDHHHHHGPDAAAAKTDTAWARLVLMGLGGGLVPCWDAVLLLVAAAAVGRLGFAFPLLVAFSLGLGLVLVALGVAVVHAHRAGQSWFKDSRWFKLLPVVSAALLVGVGFWLCKQAVRGFAG